MKRTNITDLIPHRDPFLFLDEIDVDVAAKKAVGRWTPKPSWPIFKGHFPDYPVVPGVIVIEMMAQAAVALGRGLEAAVGDKVVYLAGVDHARFRRPVLPGNTVDIYVKLEKRRRTLWTFDADARVEGKLAAQAKLLASVQEAWK